MHQSRQRMLMVALLSWFCIMVAGISHAGLQTFDTNGAGWLNPTVDNGGKILTPLTSWSETGGNTGGHVYGSVGTAADRLYGVQAPFGAGSFGDLTGQALTVDYRIDGAVTGPVGAKVRFYIGHYDGQSRYWVTKDTFSWDPNVNTSWTTHQVQLQADNFILWPNKDSGMMTFADVLTDYNDIGLVFADGFTSNETLGFSGNATIHVDNFGAVPIPAAAWLLGSGIFGLVALRRKIR